MRHIKLIIFTSLFLLSTITHAEADNISDKNEGLGFGIGAIIGGLIAGPPGAVIGAASGSFFGHKKTKEDVALTSLEKQLQQKNKELALLQSEIDQNTAQRRSEIARTMRNVSLENKNSALKELENGLSMSVYFRTNGNSIDDTLLPHIQELATLINNYPELKVQLFAHADHRGNPEHNNGFK
jgi:outer membrane protein OmpA-like peptidoglycan-associated protein